MATDKHEIELKEWHLELGRAETDPEFRPLIRVYFKPPQEKDGKFDVEFSTQFGESFVEDALRYDKTGAWKALVLRVVGDALDSAVKDKDAIVVALNGERKAHN